MSCCAVARIAVHFVHRCFLRVVDLERFVEQRALRLLHRPTLPAVTSLATDHFRVWVDRNVPLYPSNPPRAGLVPVSRVWVYGRDDAIASDTANYAVLPFLITLDVLS